MLLKKLGNISAFPAAESRSYLRTYLWGKLFVNISILFSLFLTYFTYKIVLTLARKKKSVLVQ